MVYDVTLTYEAKMHHLAIVKEWNRIIFQSSFSVTIYSLIMQCYAINIMQFNYAIFSLYKELFLFEDLYSCDSCG